MEHAWRTDSDGGVIELTPGWAEEGEEYMYFGIQVGEEIVTEIALMNTPALQNVLHATQWACPILRKKLQSSVELFAQK